jgi:galactose-6-phosphate isomerase
MIIAFGCDHIVTPLKDELVKHFKNLGHSIIDCGTYDKTRTHYPIYGRQVALKVADKTADLGVVICGTGVGISNSASKVKGSRTLLVTNPVSARQAKEKFDANIISFGGRVVGIGIGIDIIQAFIDAKYNGENKELISLINNKVPTLKDDAGLYKSILSKWHDGYYTEGQKQDIVPMPLDKKI